MASPESIIKKLSARNKRAAGKKSIEGGKDVGSYLIGALGDVNAVRRAAKEAYTPGEKAAVKRKAKKVRKKYGQ